MKYSDWLKFKAIISIPRKAILPVQMALFFLCLLPARGQFRSGRSLLQTGFVQIFPSELKKTNDSFSQSQYSFHFSLPLWQKALKKEKGIHHFQLGIQSQNRLENNSLSLISGSLFCFQAGIGANGFWRKAGGHFLVSRMSLGVFGDVRNPGSRFLRPTGNLFYGYRLNPKWNLMGGFSYNFLFGSGFALPVLGFNFRPNPKNRLMVLLPLSVRFIKVHSRHFMSQIGLRPNGGISVFGSDAFANAGQKQTLILRNRAFSLFGNLMYIPAPNWRIGLGAGLLSRRKIWISEGIPDSFSSEQNLLADNLKNGWQIQFNLAYRFLNNRKTKNDVPVQMPDIELTEDEIRNLEIENPDLFIDSSDLP